MQFRKKEFESLSLPCRWLDMPHSKHAYDYALRFSSDNRYGLNESTVSCIDRHKIDSYSVADIWLREKLQASGAVQIVYGKSDVCILETGIFLNNWSNIFVPARDDAVILHNLSDIVIFYCHEQRLEAGKRAN